MKCKSLRLVELKFDIRRLETVFDFAKSMQFIQNGKIV